MTRGYRLFLNDLFEACQYIRQFVAGMNFEQFSADEKTKSAVIRQLQDLRMTPSIPPQAGGRDIRAATNLLPFTGA